MKRRLFFIIVLLLLILAGWAIYRYFQTHQDENTLTLYGNVDVRQVDIGFRVAGQVVEMKFEEGDLVHQGDFLARLDKTPYDSQVQEAEANVTSIRASLQNAQRLLKRREELIGSEGISQEDLEDAETNKNTLTANLNSSEAALTVAKDNLRFTEVFSPAEAIVLTRIREPGTVVNPSDPVYTLSLVSPVWIRAFVDEPQLGKIAYGMRAKIYTDTPGGPIYEARIGFISPVAEFTPKTVETTQLRTDLVYRLRLYVDNPDHFLKQGMPVTVKIPLQEESSDKAEKKEP